MSKNTPRTTGTGSVPRCDDCSTRGRCLFAVLPLPHFEHFRALVRERSVAVGEPVELQGRQGSRLGVVKVGLLKGVRLGAGDDGKAIVLLGKGRLIGATNPFGQPAPLTLVAITPMRICEVDVQAVKDIAMPQPLFTQAIYRAIAAFLGSIADWSRVLREDSYLTKVCVALQMIAEEEGNPTFRIPSHRELACVLGARRETIARHISILIENGVFVKVDRWHGTLTTARCDLLKTRPVGSTRH